MPLHPINTATGVAITNPLVLYRALVATNKIAPDPAQHRLALHLQKLYYRLKDYEPEIEYSTRLKQISQAVGKPVESGRDGETVDLPRKKDRKGIWSALTANKADRDALAMTRSMTSHDAALNMNSPRGLLLHGEVGTGKSMLIDLLADSLPNRKKKRWHFSTFMLETIAQFEELQHAHRAAALIANPTDMVIEEEYSMLRLARDMISTSPILFLDEFQLPDRAASKILSNLLTSFFQLGGVLVATSNRMPEELSNAAGVEFPTASPTRGLLGTSFRGLWGRRAQPSPGMFGGKSEYAGFLDVLKARCETWDMEGGKDWRRREAEEAQAESQESRETPSGFGGLEHMKPGNLGLGYEQSKHDSHEESRSLSVTQMLPRHYFIKDMETGPDEAVSPIPTKAWDSAVRRVISSDTAEDSAGQDIPWKTSSMHVYGRTVPVHRTHNGVSLWTFSELCERHFGPADYLTLASTFHTVILTDVPVLSLLQKNEARRLINLLDALYEARCKLLIRAEAGPDDVFFPETSISGRTESPMMGTADSPASASKSPSRGDKTGSSSSSTPESDATYSETISEIEQDLTSPFRPNISAYAGSSSTEPSETPSPSPNRWVLADEDSDFGPVYPDSHARSQQDPQSPSNRHATTSSSGGRSSFTGEDEMFAYKRARSRLWEMCGARWWARGDSPEDTSWWRPLPASARRWEKQTIVPLPTIHFPIATESVPSSEAPKRPEGDPRLFRHGASPFRTSPEPPPKFSWVHAWGMMRWGRKAGKWGQGVEGLGPEQDGGGDEGGSNVRGDVRKGRDRRRREVAARAAEGEREGGS